jgi:ribose transport system substrate-binding protein
MPSTRTIAVIPQGSKHQHWKAVHAGVNKAVYELKAQGTAVEVVWKAPWREDTREEQVELVREAVKSGVQGIVLAPFNSDALAVPVEEAARAGIPTVVIDSAVASHDIVSFIASDNEKAGALAADRMVELLNGKGTVLLLRYKEGSASTNDRAKGFMTRMKQRSPSTEIILAGDFAGNTSYAARQACAELLSHHIHRVQGIFTVNEASTAGMLMALQGIQKAGKVALVGFDSSDIYLEAIRYKQLQGLVVQDPFRMGDLAVRTIVDHLTGKPVQKRVDTGVTMVTPENMDLPDAKRALNPPLA